MKRLTFIVVFLVSVFLSSATYAATADEVLEGMGNKLIRGVVNILTGWVELPMQTYKGLKGDLPGCEDNPVVGTVCGLFKGIGHAVGRTAWGGVELVGFWAANPKDNVGIGIPLDGEYAWQMGEPYDCFDPSLQEATMKPMGQKLLRGLENGLLGFVELPGQIAKGVGEKAPDLGIIKGLWYWYSREVYGIGDLVTLILPIAEDNPGVVFDQEYPWDAMVGALE